MVHTGAIAGGRLIGVGGTSNGCLAKQIQFIGRGAHAGGSPHAGINALNAAMIALSAIHAQRETFKDSDTIRVHPIITKGGEVVNIVPADVRMETFVRGKSMEAIQSANEKVDRALRAGAMAVGGKVRINTMPGYLPLTPDRNLQTVFRRNAEGLLGKSKVFPPGSHGTGSTDMGDLSQIMPAMHPFSAGASGTSHGDDFIVDDYEKAVINPAKVLAATVIDLLADGAAEGRQVVSRHKPKLSRREYIDLMESLRRDELYEG
jgi:metal-dependent amidase/aminoacylase/carboxypeptidase family protein